MTTNEKVLIKVENLQKSFEDNKVLDGISTEIHQGEVVAVIGPSGSGKSTFLRSLNRLEIPTGGKIYFEGVDITAPETDIDHVRQKIGMVFQQFNLFPHKTVKENILLAPVTLKLMTPEEAEKKSDGASDPCRTAGQKQMPIREAFPADRSSESPSRAPCDESGCHAV